MKKIFFTCSIILTALSGIAQINSDFQGKIVFEINFDNNDLPPEALQMLQGAEAVTYIAKNFRRVDINMPIQSTRSIVNTKSKTVTTLIDIMGQKYLIAMTEADLKKEEEKLAQTTFKYLDEYKTIAGYNCKKAEVTLKSKEGREDVLVVYYTEEIPANDIKAAYKGLKGFPLEYQIVQSGINMKFLAKSVSKELIPQSLFDLPKEGYKEATMEEFQKEMLKFGSQ